MSYAKLKNHFSQLHPKGVLSLNINAIHYKSVQGTKEIQSFTTQEKSGRLIGIIGREGVGKTTLLKLIAGQIKPGKGHISINGYDLWRYNYLLKGIIGYVPENDLLHDELTVYENLILTARLFYSNIGKHEIENRIEKLLEKLELSELKNVVVGNMYSKHVQPGQRRILNIALELIREPQLLIVDNAVSGLGMADASKVIKILHDYSYEGNLVITTISQVGSSSFRYFDKIWILDTQGHAVYNGTTYDCTTYLHKHLNLAYQKQENPDPSQLLDLVYYSVPDASGKILKRVLSPEQWQKIFNNEHAKSQQPKPDKGLLPARILKIPNLEVQLFIFSLRNFKCKFSRIRNIVSGLLAGPLIAGALAILLRYKINGEYIFARNNNIALYQYLSVIIAMTLGLILSANEILKERNIFKKEEYLELSRFSYINSKILYLFPIIGLQTLLYVLTGNMILGIKDMFYAYWVVLFSSGCSGILLGLLLSASIRHIETIYEKIIPVVIAIQLILGGGIIPYNNLNLGGGKYSPVLGDLTVSRWGYEALAVEQYKDNRYQKYFFDMDKHISNASFNAFQLIPRMQELLTRCNTGLENKDSMKYYTGILKTELTKLAEDPDIFPFEYINELSQDASKNILTEASDYLTYLSMHFYEEYEKMVQKKNLLTEKLEDSLGVNALQKIKNDYNNDRLEKIVTAENLETEYDIYDREIVRKSGPIFQEPQSNYGRAVFFCPTKLFNGQYMDTIWFNISIIWMLSFIFYLLLLTDISKLIRRLFNREPL